MEAGVGGGCGWGWSDETTHTIATSGAENNNEMAIAIATNSLRKFFFNQPVW